VQYSDLNHGRTSSYDTNVHHAFSEMSDQARPNNFRLLRFLTALTVAATHCLWIVYGFNPSTEGTLRILIQASHCGICIFFGLSGYLITSSLIERPNFLHFTVSRIIRLCPLLIFSSLLIAFVFGPFFTTASFSAYYDDWRLWAYVPVTALSYSDMTLPGLFENAPAGGEVNVSIWTLKYEIIAYIALGLLASLGMLHHRIVWIWSALAIATFLYVSYFTQLRAEIPFLMHGFRFGFAFLIGVLLYTYRPILPINLIGVFLVVGFAAYTNSTAYMEPFRIIALTYTAIWFGSLRPYLLNFYNRFGDYSYGIFVFHWPIAQLVLQTNPGISYGDLLIWVLPITLGFAVVSWHGIEAPLLAARFSLADRLYDLTRSLRTKRLKPRTSFLTHISEPTYRWGKRGFDIMTSYPAPEANPQTPEQVASRLSLEQQNSHQYNRHFETIKRQRYEAFGYLPFVSSDALATASRQVETATAPARDEVPASFRPQATAYPKPRN
jgi:peptidoglycan/LPS O-acetylase OafA/YrhL